MADGVGILGGTFDPIHVAHLRVAEEVREAEDLTEMRLVPAAVPPHKAGRGVAPAHHRLRMVQLAVEGIAGFRAWDIELTRTGPSYSVDTLRALRAELGPDARVVFVLGRDAFADFATWREPDVILGLCDVVVVTRPPWPATLDVADFPVAARNALRYDPGSECIRHASGHRVKLLPITPLDVSATALRARVAAHHSIRFLVPPSVEAYIARHGLYQEEESAR